MDKLNKKLKGNVNSIRNIEEPKEKPCSLLAKDSEWVDIFQNSDIQCCSTSDGEKIDCQVGYNTQVQPLALMFPGILENDPEMLKKIINKVISTTEMTKNLVGQKANFTCMKKVDRLIPVDKKWLDSLPENSNSCSSDESRTKILSNIIQTDDNVCDEKARKTLPNRGLI